VSVQTLATASSVGGRDVTVAPESSLWLGISQPVSRLDCAFLVSLLGLSVLPYIVNLGFYSDDWNFLGMFVTSDDQSFFALVAEQWNLSTDLRVRPTQMVYQASLYSAFGLDPLGYHIVNAVVLAIMSMLFYVVLRVLGFPRVVALAIPSVYALMPNFSTNRFWFASFGYSLTITLYLLSLYADIRAVSTPGKRSWLWKLCALVAAVASGLGYEVVIALLLVSPLVVWIWARRSRVRITTRRRLVYAGTHFLLVGVVVAYKLSVAIPAGYIDVARGVRRLVLAFIPNFGTYGIGLPYAAWWGVRHTTSISLVVSMLLAIVVFSYLFMVGRDGNPGVATLRSWVVLGVSGLAVFVLGYAVFLTTGRFSYSSSSYGNRISMAGAMGVAIVLTAFAGSVASRGPPFRRTIVFCAAVAALCQCGFLINTALSRHHTAAWSKQQQVVETVMGLVPRLPPHSTVILRGMCPYAQTAIVFERGDFEGALWVLYRDRTLVGDVGSKVVVRRDAVVTTATGFAEAHPYHRRLLVVDIARSEVATLTGYAAALKYFGAREVGWPANCPAGAPDAGVPLFPADRLFVEKSYPTFP
jgi:hypothetical protein